MNSSFRPLIHFLPLSLAGKAHTTGAVADTNSNASDTSLNGGRSAASPSTGGTYDIEKTERSGLVNANNAGAGDVEDFYHPAAVEPQRVVWVPRDTLGLGEAEVAANNTHGVQSSLAGAQMDGKGHVSIDGPPPGEEI